MSASELKQDRKTYSQHFDEFRRRIASVCLDEVQILPTLGRYNLSFWGYFVWGGVWLNELEKEIQAILFSKDEAEYGDYCRKYGYDEKIKEKWNDWVNHQCDVLTIWSHIWYGGDIFVTRDSNFLEQTKKLRLVKLGAGKILRPTEAVKMLDC